MTSREIATLIATKFTFSIKYREKQLINEITAALEGAYSDGKLPGAPSRPRKLLGLSSLPDDKARMIISGTPISVLEWIKEACDYIRYLEGPLADAVALGDMAQLEVGLREGRKQALDEAADVVFKDNGNGTYQWFEVPHLVITGSALSAFMEVLAEEIRKLKDKPFKGEGQ